MHTLQQETLYPSETTGEHLALGIGTGTLLGFLGGLLSGYLLIGMLIGMIPGLVVGILLYRHTLHMDDDMVS